MATFSWDCPQPKCRAQKAAFVAKMGVWNEIDQRSYVFGVCPICRTPTTFVVVGVPETQPSVGIVGGYDGDPFNGVGAAGVLRNHGLSSIRIERTIPPPPTTQVPESVPPNISQPFLEGLRARDSNMLPSAVYNLRKALERTVRQQDPQGSGGLKSRIKALADGQKIPPTLVALAHTVRAEGNVEVHEDEDWTPAQVQELIDFTVLLLTYVFTLPVRIAAIAEHRGAPAAER